MNGPGRLDGQKSRDVHEASACGEGDVGPVAPEDPSVTLGDGALPAALPCPER